MPIIFDEVPRNRALNFTKPEEFAAHFWNNPNLSSLSVDSYQGSYLPRLPESLEFLSLENCPNLTSLGLPASLKNLALRECAGLTSVAKLPGSLKSMFLFDLPALKSLYLQGNLEHLEVDNCPELQDVVFGEAIRLVAICRSGLQKLPTLPATLELLTIVGCPLEELPSLPDNLKSLSMKNCTALKEVIELKPGIPSITFENCPNVFLTTEVASSQEKDFSDRGYDC